MCLVFLPMKQYNPDSGNSPQERWLPKRLAEENCRWAVLPVGGTSGLRGMCAGYHSFPHRQVHFPLCIGLSQCESLTGVNGLLGSEDYLVNWRCFLGSSSLLLKSRNNTAWRGARQMAWPSPFPKGLGNILLYTPCITLLWASRTDLSWQLCNIRYYIVVNFLGTSHVCSLEVLERMQPRSAASSEQVNMLMKDVYEGRAKAWS